MKTITLEFELQQGNYKLITQENYAEACEIIKKIWEVK